jgi:hypothetical protein
MKLEGITINDLVFAPKPKKRTFRDLEGERFGRQLVLGYKGKSGNGHSDWYCLCDCGSLTVVNSNTLLRGHSKSCGCLGAEIREARKVKHGMSRTRVYRIWRLVIARCTQKSNSSYARYGAAGITICDRWRHSFENFYADMGEPPTDQHSLDRKDNNKDYSPENCRWATRLEQQNNRKVNRRFTFEGRSQTVAEWCRELGLNDSTVRSRINDRDWSIGKALGLTKT